MTRPVDGTSTGMAIEQTDDAKNELTQEETTGGHFHSKRGIL